ncbi:MAG: hypothetical protein HUU25_02690 [Candidatus Sumerlaeia bacterium]|nr:hypothetical protein [Candidatus Sumerlaeia bacterium]
MSPIRYLCALAFAAILAAPAPAGVARFFVVDQADDVFYKYTETFGANVTQATSAANADQTEIHVDNTHVYVLDNNDKIVYRYTGYSSNASTASRGLRNGAGGALGTLDAMAIDGDDLFVADDTNNQFRHYSLSSAFTGAGTINSDAVYAFADDGANTHTQAQAMAVDSTYIYIADDNDDRIYRYLRSAPAGSTASSLLRTTAGTALGTIEGIAVHSGVLYVVVDSGGAQDIVYTYNSVDTVFLTPGTQDNANAATNLTGANDDSRGIALNPIPTVQSIVRADPDPTNAASVTFTVTFSEAVTGVGTADFTLATAGVTGATISGISADTGATRTVTVNTGSGSGTIGLNFVDDDTVVDIGSLPIGGTNGTPANFTGEVYTVDKDGPTVNIGAPTPAATNSGPIDFAVTYTGAATVDLQTGDVTLDTTGTASGTVSVIDGATATPTVRITGVAGDGTIGITLAADVAQDGVGNGDPGAGPSATANVDNTAPATLIGAPSAALTTGGPVTFEVTYSGATTVDLQTGDVTLDTTGTATGTVSVIDGATATPIVEISGVTGDGTIGITLAADVAQDAAGNGDPGAGPSATFTVDNTSPEATAITPGTSGPVNSAATVSFEVTFDEDVIDFVPADVIINHAGTAGGNASVSGSGDTWTVEIDGVTGDGTYTVEIQTGVGVTDLAGNGLGASAVSGAVIIDNTSPQVATFDPHDLAVSPAVADIDFAEANSMGAGVTDPSNYTLSGDVGTLAANPDSVVFVSGTTYQLTWNTGQTPYNGAVMITVSTAVEDAAANPILAGNGDTGSGNAVPVELSVFSAD